MIKTLLQFACPAAELRVSLTRSGLAIAGKIRPHFVGHLSDQQQLGVGQIQLGKCLKEFRHAFAQADTAAMHDPEEDVIADFGPPGAKLLRLTP